MSTYNSQPAIDADGNVIGSPVKSAPDPIRAVVYAYAMHRGYAHVMGDDPSPVDPLTLETIIRWNPTLGGTILMLDPRYTPRQVGDLDPERAMHAWIGAVCDARGDRYGLPDAYGAVRATVRRGRSKKGATAKVTRHGVPIVVGALHNRTREHRARKVDDRSVAAAFVVAGVRRRVGGWNGNDVTRLTNMLYPELPRMRGSSDTFQGQTIFDADRSDHEARARVGLGDDDNVRKPRGSRIRLPYVARKADPKPTASALAAARTDDTMWIGHRMVQRGERARVVGKRAARTVDALTFRSLDALLAHVAVVDLAKGARMVLSCDTVTLSLTRSNDGRYRGTVKREDGQSRNIAAARTLLGLSRKVALAAA